MSDGSLQAITAQSSITDRVRDSIREAIIDGRLAPGSLHSVQTLATAFGVSRTPVREALIDLAGAGMAEFERNRGVRILQTSIHDLEEILSLRLLLEVPAAHRAAEQASPETIAALRAELASMREAAQRDDEVTTMTHDRRFHELINEASGNARLAKYVDSLRDLILTRGVSTVGQSRDLPAIIDEHSAVLRAVEAHDADAAASAMKEHICNTASLLLKQETGHESEPELRWAKPGGRVVPKLVRLSLANWRRQRLRTGLTIGSLTLSVGAVVFVYSLSIAFQDAGSNAVEEAVGQADIWIVPPDGITVDRDRGTVQSVGELPVELADEIASLPGVTGVESPTGSGAGTLQVTADDPRTVAEGIEGLGITVTGDPSRTEAESGRDALAYLVTVTTGRFSVYTFTQEFEAVQVNEVAASVLGVVGRVTLALGFLSVLTSLLISIDERRREFGILAAVGITDDVLYLFLVESALLIGAGLVAGVITGGILFGLLLPGVFAVGTVLKAVALVSVYFPIMLIGGALIPAWRLLQKSPLELLKVFAVIRSLRYTARIAGRSRGSVLLRSSAAAIASALTFFVLAQSATVRAQASDLAVGGIDATLVERATFSLTVIAIAVGALQIGVLMTRIVLQRMHEIGILKAAGVATSDIFWIFAFEALMYGLVGGILGCLIGLLVSVTGPMPEAGEALRAAAVTIGLSVLVSTLAGLAPARRAVRAPAVEALSHAW